MQLITTETITYRQPPTEAQAEALAAWRAENRTRVPDDKDAETTARREAHKAELERLAAAAGETAEYRFRLSTATVAGAGRFNAAIYAAYQDYTEQTGRPIASDLRSDDNDRIGEALQHSTRAGDYAAILAALESIEERTRPRVDADGGKWRPVEIPAEWSTMDGFYSHVPAGLIQRLAHAAHMLNPGLWRRQTDDEAAEKNA